MISGETRGPDSILRVGAARIVSLVLHVSILGSVLVTTGKIIVEFSTCGFGGTGGGGGAGIGILAMSAMVLSAPATMTVQLVAARRVKGGVFSLARWLRIVAASLVVPFFWGLLMAIDVSIERSPYCLFYCLASGFKDYCEGSLD